jgi:hypothetical protein
MPKFDLKNLNPGIWFEYEDGRICLRAVSDSDIERIRKEASNEVIEYKQFGRGQRQRFETVKVDFEKSKHLLWDAVILSWEGFLDADGKALECNQTNKIMLMTHVSKFEKFVNRCIDQIAEDEEKKVKGEEKN